MDTFDNSIRFQLDEGLAGSASVNLQAVHKDSDGDEFVSRNFLHHLIHGGLVHGDGIVGLFLNLSLRPLLQRQQETSD